MQGEVEVGVGGVDGVGFGGEVPELAVVGVADWADGCEERFGGGGGRRGRRDEGYAVRLKLGKDLGETCGGREDGVI